MQLHCKPDVKYNVRNCCAVVINLLGILAEKLNIFIQLIFSVKKAIQREETLLL